MKKLFTIALSIVLVTALATLYSHKANAVLPQLCGGRPFLTTFKLPNFQGEQRIWCSQAISGTPGWYDINVSYVGDDWNDQTVSYKLWSWPQKGYTISFYNSANFASGPRLDTSINHDPETNSNACRSGWQFCRISSFKITWHP